MEKWRGCQLGAVKTVLSSARALTEVGDPEI